MKPDSKPLKVSGIGFGVVKIRVQGLVSNMRSAGSVSECRPDSKILVMRTLKAQACNVTVSACGKAVSLISHAIVVGLG